MRAPHPALAGDLGAYVGYRHLLDPSAVHRGLPAPTATVIVAFDDPLDVSWPDGRAGRTRLWLSASGLHTRPALIHTHGVQHGIQLSLTPAGCRRLLGLPIGALADLCADHADLPLGIPEHLHAALAATDDWSRRYALLERHLLEAAHGVAAAGVRPMRAEVAHAWSRLLAAHGDLRVEALAADVGWSRRQLSKQFVAEFGVTPKQAARVMRFDHARRLLDSGVGLAEAAYACGYADQPHLNRDWADLAGATPTRTLAEPFPILQEPEGALQAG